jgi:DNA repair exonuclease SbcCD ATPase subunit
VTAASRELERQTDDLSRERPRSSGARGEKDAQSLPFQEAKRAEAVAQSQQALMQQAEALKRSLEALRKSAEAAGLGDTAWQRQLAEIGQELDRALSPELRARLQELQQALKQLDAERTQEALQQLAEKQQEMREALERSRELFRRAALEGDLANLGRESKELAQEQHEWNRQVERADSAHSALAERQLAERADSLAAALDRLGKAVGDTARQARLDAAGQQAGQAG